MRIRFTSALCLTLAVIVPAAGAAGAKKTHPATAKPVVSEARNEALLSYQKDLVSVLAPRADATHLLGAALLARPLPKQPKYNDFHSLIERAAKADDAGPAISWTRLTDCNAKANACPNADALDALTRQAGDNAAPWLIKLGRDHDDEAAAREDLAKAADARLYDDYTGVALSALATTAGTLPAPEATLDPASEAGPYGVQVVMVYGLAGLQPQPQPGMQAAASMCVAGKDDDTTKAQCLKLAHVLEWGSSPLGRSLGLHLRETLSDDPADQASAHAAVANLSWQVRNFAGLSSRARNDKVLAQHLLRLARSGGTEMSIMLAALREAGIPADAPDASGGSDPAAAASSADAPSS